MLERQLYLVDKKAQAEYFRGMILPNIWKEIDHPNVFLIGAVENEKAVGAAVLRMENRRAQLLSIAVEESRRRQGIGTALLKMCVRTLRRTSIQTLYLVLLEGETEAKALISAFGMTILDTASTHYSVLLKDVAAVPALQNGGNKTYPLESVPDLMLSRFMNMTFPLDSELGKRELFEPKVSRFLIENGEVTACLLMEKVGDELFLGWISSRSPNKRAVVYLVKEALAAAAAEYPEDTKISFTAYQAFVVQLAEGLLGDAAEKYSVSEWILEDSAFRLKDTDLMGWEVN